MEENFIKYIEQSIKDHWDLPALTDFKGATSSYKDVARKIEKLHLLFEHCGIRKGDKIALCSRNTSSWGIAFLATLSYGAVAVPILNEFKPDNVHHIVNHSEARLLFAGDVVWENLDESAMPDLDGVLRIEDYSLRTSNSKQLTEARARLNELFGKKFPDRFRAEDVHYEYDTPDQLAVINYTSGTTSSSKGVMLPYRSLWTNLQFAIDTYGINPGEQIVCMLPMAHMYGLAFEFIYQFVNGTHIHFLSRTPSPKIIADAFATVKPDLIITVPLVIEKIIKKKVFPTIEKPHMKLLMNIPIINDKIRESIRQKVIDAFGGKFKELIIGGAALNKEVEIFLRSIRFPYTVGYGMTECGPLLTYDNWKTFRQSSCGKAVPRVELRIDSGDPQHIVGEILAKGICVMTGYYKNPEAPAAAIGRDGWLHTGDMVMVQSGHVGHAAVIPEELDNTAAHALIMFRNPKEEIEPYFLNYEYQTDKAKKQIENITTGNTIKHILASDMQEFVVDIPKYEEQKAIAGYFCKLDHLITLHQRKCDKYSSIKKGMMSDLLTGKIRLV